MIKSITFSRIELKHRNHVDKLIKVVENLYLNGGIILQRFKLNNIEDSGRYHKGWNQVVWQIINHNNLIGQLDGVSINENKPDMPSDFRGVSSFEILSNLAAIVNHGGAYSKIDDQLNDNDSVNLAWTTIKQLFPDEMSKYHMFKTYTPWTNWHYGIAWDYSFFMFGKGYKELTVILITDTD